MSKIIRFSHTLFLIIFCVFLLVLTACNQDPNASKISLVPEPFFESGIYNINGLAAGGG